ncbi:MAG: metallophosphoesterase [Candidatus Obscuribacterales bacterium]|nr:metallophosphoesterase [Candidatus Obscuribacterales bacterium]
MSLNLLQLTDTHLFADRSGTLKGVSTYQSLEMVVSLAQKEESQTDIVVLTGDLSQDETIESYRNVNEIVSRLERPAYYIPGNHDDTAIMLEPLTLGGKIERKRSHCQGVWRLVFLDSCQEGKIEGYLSDAELLAFEKELLEADEPNVLIFLHHNPVNLNDERVDSMMLKNADSFFSILDRFEKVRAVVWGHVHQEFQSKRGDVELFASPSTCVQFRATATGLTIDARAPGYRVFKLEDDGSIKSYVRRLVDIPVGLRLIEGDL